MPGRFFQPAINSRLSGLSSGNWPRIAKRFGYLTQAASATAPELGSQPGGWISAASTPAASISFRQSSAEYDGICRCIALVGRFCDQRWICASTIFMGCLLFPLERYRKGRLARFAHGQGGRIASTGYRGFALVPGKTPATIGRGGGAHDVLVVAAPIEGDQGLAGENELNPVALVPATSPGAVPADPAALAQRGARDEQHERQREEESPQGSGHRSNPGAPEGTS